MKKIKIASALKKIIQNNLSGAMKDSIDTLQSVPECKDIALANILFIKNKYKKNCSPKFYVGIFENRNKIECKSHFQSYFDDQECCVRIFSVEEGCVEEKKECENEGKKSDLKEGYKTLGFVANNPLCEIILIEPIGIEFIIGLLYASIWGSNVLIFSGNNINGYTENIFEAAFDEKIARVVKCLNMESIIDQCCSFANENTKEKIISIKDRLQKLSENNAQETRLERYEDAFDREFYSTNYPDVVASGYDLFLHYSTWGWKEGRRPNDWFDHKYYVELNKLDLSDESDPLLHYVKVGQFKNLKTKLMQIDGLPAATKASIPAIVYDNVVEGFSEYNEIESLEYGVKAIAFYLPQFHPFPENDLWWGKGFTEWYNVTKAVPNFVGHYQPHLPIHCGFYDLRVPEVMYEQAQLAKNYGIYGFNFYYYWFGGKVLMGQPFDILLNNKAIDIKYCLTWANENWTRRWDGAENDVLIGQSHSDQDSLLFLDNISKFFNDDRYIRIDNKPILIIYRPNIIPRMKETVALWRDKSIELGFDGLYLIGAQTFGFEDPNDYGFDAAIQFPPHTVKSNIINDSVELINENYRGEIYSYDEVVCNACKSIESDYKKFNTVMLSWDNTARKQDQSHIFANFSLKKYKQWLSYATNNTYNDSRFSKSEKFVFVNAWNEWAEGTHLEPDRKYGYSYLKATQDVLRNYQEKFYKALHKRPIKNNEFAMVVHIHYTDLWEDILVYLEDNELLPIDYYFTITNVENDIITKILDKFPKANIQLVENRGRDILPFINTYRLIKSLNYSAICKIHSKKSVYRTDGEVIRNKFYEVLLRNKTVLAYVSKNLASSNNKIGLIAPKDYFIKHSPKNMYYCKTLVLNVCDYLGFKFRSGHFPAGSMYWFKPEALASIEKLTPELFSPEEGLTDGTLPHAIERIVSNLVEHNGFECRLV